jgi:hypothetical protein
VTSRKNANILTSPLAKTTDFSDPQETCPASKHHLMFWLFRHLSERARKLWLLQLLLNRAMLARVLLGGLLVLNLNVRLVQADGPPVFMEPRPTPLNPYGLQQVESGNQPTFADFDGDGDWDAFIGESDGNIRFFRNDGGAFSEITGSANPFNGVDVGYHSAPAFADLDEDGDLDAFIGEDEGTINFFRNDGSTFSEITGSTNPFHGVDVGERSAPSFADLDGDGDLDAFIGEYDGNINFFRNNGGNFSEITGSANPFNGVDVGDDDINPAPYNASAPTFVDLDEDGDLDAFIGEYWGNINFFRNNGGSFSEITGSANPFNGVDVGFDSAPAFADLDGDGDLDAFIGSYNGNIYFFENIGGPAPPNLILPPFNLRAAYPGDSAFADLDEDGDLDAFIGASEGTIHFLRNDGNIFSEIAGSANPFNGVDVGEDSAPTFADLDGDGDLDAFIGGSEGNIDFFRNDGGSFSEITGSANPFNGVDVGWDSTPTFADLDGDGDLDAFIGESDGNINFFRNDGGTFSEITGAANPFNGVDVGDDSAPTFADLDEDGDLDAFIGELDGNINFFRNNGGTFSEITGSANPFNGVDVWNGSAPAFADLDEDGDLDAFIGGKVGLIYFENLELTYLPIVLGNS